MIVADSPGAGHSERASEAGVNTIASARGTPRIGPTGLRSYGRNSPYAAARIVAVALVSNGRIKSVEAATLDAAQAHALLGMERHEWYEVLRDLRLDLMHVHRPNGFTVPDAALQQLFDDVTETELQRLVAALCVLVIHADRRMSQGEKAFLAMLQRQWGLAVQPEASALLLRERAGLRREPVSLSLG